MGEFSELHIGDLVEYYQAVNHWDVKYLVIGQTYILTLGTNRPDNPVRVEGSPLYFAATAFRSAVPTKPDVFWG
jgi:hypothetical protein